MTSNHSAIFIKIILAGLMILSLPVIAAAQTENVCIQCHGTLSGRFGEPVKLWRESIHSENSVTCNECHGGDPADAANAMSPSRGFIGVPQRDKIPDVCGRCHIGVKKDYMSSAHGRALDKGGPTCVTCHSNHAVKKASLDLINERNCSRCHSYEKAGRLRNAMAKTENMIVATGDKIAFFKKEGFDTDVLEKELFSARNQFHALSHELDVPKVQNESALIMDRLEKVGISLDKFDTEKRKRKIAGVFIIGGALLAALLFYLLRKTYD
jgi:hypothetical protein